MKKEDLIILILGVLLLAGMVLTVLFGGEKSRHGVGNIYQPDTIPSRKGDILSPPVPG
ncbi:MAG: hypothetical protein Kow0089_18390 [Desulfobulbaceae bacterium]